MTDCFALLDQPRRPWLDPDLLKQRFLELSASVHPDRVHDSSDSDKLKSQAHFTELNAAFRCLSEPRLRVQHLLELETGARPAQVDQIPPDLIDVFSDVGAICRRAQALMAAPKPASALLEVQAFERRQELIDALRSVQTVLRTRVEALLARLKVLDTEWVRNKAGAVEVPKELLSELEDVYRLLGYFNRWSSQIQERALQLSI